jgi:hypothetical protein
VPNSGHGSVAGVVVEISDVIEQSGNVRCRSGPVKEKNIQVRG